MSNRKLAVLGIVAAVMVAWAIVQPGISDRPTVSGVAAGAALLQGLDPAAIGSIILQGGGKTATLLRQGGGFVIAEKANYPAVTNKINNLITSCLDIKTAELITSDKAAFTELGVSDDKPLTSITFRKPDKSTITGILVGKTKESQGSYVRLASSDKAYLSVNVPYLPTAAMDYIDTILARVKRDDIAAIRADGPDGEYVITQEADRNALLANVPAGKRARTAEVEQVFTVLTNLSFEDVKKDQSGLKFDRTYVCELKDSTVYTIKLAVKGGKTYARFSVDMLDKSPVVKRPGVESDAELKAKEAKLLARDRVVEFARRTEGWLYEIPEPIAKNLTAKFAGLIQDEPAQPPAGPGSAKK